MSFWQVSFSIATLWIHVLQVAAENCSTNIMKEIKQGQASEPGEIVEARHDRIASIIKQFVVTNCK